MHICREQIKDWVFKLLLIKGQKTKQQGKLCSYHVYIRGKHEKSFCWHVADLGLKFGFGWCLGYWTGHKIRVRILAWQRKKIQSMARISDYGRDWKYWLGLLKCYWAKFWHAQQVTDLAWQHRRNWDVEGMLDVVKRKQCSRYNCTRVVVPN